MSSPEYLLTGIYYSLTMAEFIDMHKLRDRISLVDFLSRLGFEPSRRSGKELMYISMLRLPESTPSFCVNEELGVWYDHGTGRGGTVIDFGKAYWEGLSFQEVLVNIHQNAGLEPGFIANSPMLERNPRIPVREKKANYGVLQVKDLGNNPAITAYLQHRNIWKVAQGRLQEIYYYVEDESHKRKQFFAAGWQNEKGGWEVRSPYFKGCLGKKAMSFIDNKSGKYLAVFEGYINYLSWLAEHPEIRQDVLVLNTLSFLDPAIERCSSFEKVNVFFDHDNSGRSATTKLLALVSQASDRSDIYSRHNDYNDKLMAEGEADVKIVQSTIPSQSELGAGLGK
jgi:hypothetical protein